MPLTFYSKVSRQSMWLAKSKQPWYWNPLCCCSSCDIKRTRKSKGAHGCAGKKFNGGFCKVRELWQTEEQIWRKRSSSVSTASSILTTKPKHIFIAISQIVFNWKIHAEWRQIRRNMENTLRGREVLYSRIWNEKGEAVKYETIKQLSKNRQRNYHLQKSASAGE